jgi:hypothetical protein
MLKIEKRNPRGGHGSKKDAFQIRFLPIFAILQCPVQLSLRKTGEYIPQTPGYPSNDLHKSRCFEFALVLQ